MTGNKWVGGLWWLVAAVAGAQPLSVSEGPVQSDGRSVTEIVSARLVGPLPESPTATGGGVVAPAQFVTLPDSWSKPQRSGRWVYRWDVDFAQAPAEPWGLYIPRIGNRFHVAINARSVGHSGVFGVTSFNSGQKPYLISVPRDTLTAGLNRFEIEIEGERNRYAGLARVQMGPERELRPPFVLRSAAQLGGSFAVVVMCGLFGAFAAALYVRLRQPSDAFFAAACLLCSLRTSYFVVETAPIPFRQWAWVADMSYGGLVACIVAFCVRALALNAARWDRLGMGFFVLSVGLTTWNMFAESHLIRQVWLQLMLGYVLVMSAVFVWQWHRQRTVTAGLLGAAAIGGAVIGVHDHWLVYYSAQGFGGFALARFALVLFILAMGWIIVERLVSRMKEERSLREAVAQELAESKRALAQEFEAKAQWQAERAQTLEREKLIQDLHDGMGLQLNSLLGLVEKGEAEPAEVQTEVRNSIEQLRAIVDGSEAFDGSLPELLGHIRHRIETRLRRQGIRLIWSGLVEAREARVHPAAAISLQRLIFELCTNVIKHAQAQNVSFSATLTDQAAGRASLIITFEDDGTAAATAGGAHSSGTGQRSVQRRVTELGGVHEPMVTPDGGWKHQLLIPLNALEI
jgi:signal transduction histidine kinase